MQDDHPLRDDPKIQSIVEDIKRDKLGGDLFYGGSGGPSVRFCSEANREFVKRGGTLDGLGEATVGRFIGGQLKQWWRAKYEDD